jgi:hypothetical protein
LAAGRPGDNCLVVPQYVPMAPAQVRQPFHRPGWVYEEKLDVLTREAEVATEKGRRVKRGTGPH